MMLAFDLLRHQTSRSPHSQNRKPSARNPVMPSQSRSKISGSLLGFWFMLEVFRWGFVTLVRLVRPARQALNIFCVHIRPCAFFVLLYVQVLRVFHARRQGGVRAGSLTSMLAQLKASAQFLASIPDVLRCLGSGLGGSTLDPNPNPRALNPKLGPRPRTLNPNP